MAEACQEDGCSVETVSNLLDQLKAKKTELQVYQQNSPVLDHRPVDSGSPSETTALYSNGAATVLAAVPICRSRSRREHGGGRERTLEAQPTDMDG